MEEKKVVGVVDFPVRRTGKAGMQTEEVRWGFKDYREAFDNMPIREVREACLSEINPDWEDNVNWLIKRVEAYLKIDDYETVCMLFRELCRHQGSQKQRILDLMVDSIRSGMGSSYAYNNIKDMLVILCGKLLHEKNLYNENARKLFREIIEKFHEQCVFGSDDRKAQLISRILFVIAAVKDRTFIPILKKINIDKENLAHLMEYVSISKERINLEGLRMIVLRYLKGE
ncbi:MAG: hypothetical protein Q7S78_02690 [Candidatus Azambacteria bacterium]|nr:hypothetical protein [Candidatus Azambacteria bacterium]